jgi:hypothetical protein
VQVYFNTTQTVADIIDDFDGSGYEDSLVQTDAGEI